MLPQEPQGLRVRPSSRNGPICCLERSVCLRPLTTLGSGAFPGLRGSILSLFLSKLSFCGRSFGGGILGGPVVDIPVILIEEAVVFLELFR